MLNEFSVHASLATSDLPRARAWYEDKLGAVAEATFDGLIAFRLDGTLFTVYQTASAGTARNTVAGWDVADVRSEVARLRQRGVVFEDYDQGPLKTIDGVAEVPGGLAAWLKDPDGNILGIAQGMRGFSTYRGMVAVVAASDLSRARAFYSDRLGLAASFERPGLVGFASGQTGLTVYETSAAGTARNTVAVWRVHDLHGLVRDLRDRGVAFQDYDFGDARTVDGVIEDPDGASNAWFADSEGNILALAEDISLPMQ